MNLTYELIDDYKKCMNDIEYFAEQHIKVNHPENGLVPIKLNSFQKQAIKDYNNENEFAKIANRMEGKTLVAAIILLHQSLFNEYRVSTIFAPKLAASNSMLELIFKLYENLPDHIKMVKITKRNNSVLQLSNMCSIISCGNNVNMGRGRGISNIYVDESEFMSPGFLNDIFQALYPSMAISSHKKFFAFTSTRTSEIFKVV